MDVSGEMLFNARMSEEAEFQPVFPHLRSVVRISRIPVVESTLEIATGVYTRIKDSNRLIAWGLGTAESSVQVAVTISRPFISILEKPLGLVDGLVCKSLDLVEEKVPVITLPPELIIVSTRDYVQSNIVQPALKRADTLKQLGVEKATNALNNKYAEFAAIHIDTALEVADRYIDVYLPDTSGKKDSPRRAVNDVGGIKAFQTLHHADLVSRKLQRRLSQRAMQEFKVLKQSVEDTKQTLLYVLELGVKDPKGALEEACQLWTSTSEKELDNQTQPTDLKQWIILLTRRLNCRMAKLINYIRSKHLDELNKQMKAANIEQWLYMATHETLRQLNEIVLLMIRLPATVSHEVVVPVYQQTADILHKFLDSTNSYMKTTVVQPVLKRTNSFKQFSLEQANHILDSKYAEFAADRLETALDVADKYIDQYLPDELSGQPDPSYDHFQDTNDIGGSKAKQTIHHVDQFSRKLQRRLTQRTLMEAKAFKQGGEDTLQYLIFLAELFARDPKTVYQMALELWAKLSGEEPENQVPPANLEQLLVVLVRETARRFVHLTNYMGNGVVDLPQKLSILLHTLLVYSIHLKDFLIKASHFEEAKYLVISEANNQILHIQKLLQEINEYISQIFEHIPGNVAGNPNSKTQSGNTLNGSTIQLESDSQNLSAID